VRTSSYVIYVGLREESEYYILHGYTGAVDAVGPEVIRYLLAHTDPGRTGPARDETVIRECVGHAGDREVESDTIQTLASRGYLTDKSAEAERAYVEGLAELLHKRELTRARPGFLIVPTYSCNLRCPYCYQAALRRLGKVMTRETADAAFRCIDLLRDRHHDSTREPADGTIPYMVVGLYGGEPLMRATARIVRYIVQEGRGRHLRFSATTNAVDLDQFLDLLGPDGIRQIQVTLDGPKDIHDTKRIGPKYPQGTYETILRNVGLALERDASVGIRLHINWDAVDRAKELMDDLDARGLLAHKHLAVYAETTHSWMRGHAAPVPPEMAQSDIHECLRQSCSGLARPLRATDHGLVARLERYVRYGLAGICSSASVCSSQTAMYILDLFGDIYPCWEIVGEPELKIGEFSAAAPVFNERERAWRGRTPATIPDCATCKYAVLHFGGCPAIPLRTGGELAAPACYDYEDAFISLSRRFFRSAAFRALGNSATAGAAAATVGASPH